MSETEGKSNSSCQGGAEISNLLILHAHLVFFYV